MGQKHWSTTGQTIIMNQVDDDDVHPNQGASPGPVEARGGCIVVEDPIGAGDNHVFTLLIDAAARGREAARAR